MVSPVTNCSPIMRMATSTPLRINGSPPRASNRPRAELRPRSLCVATSLPVTIRPQAAALTNIDGLWPRWAFQSPSRILSRIRASRVAVSGMRSNASARHMRATPSCDDSENSCNRPCTRPALPAAPLRSRRPRTTCSASRRQRCAISGGKVAACTSAGRMAGSGRRQARVIASRKAVRAGRGVMAEKGGQAADKGRLDMAGSVGRHRLWNQ
ncbi:Uncharacterised protein [Bordetella trematum]|nr:Uncharacterised protein [Bordetella trematum]